MLRPVMAKRGPLWKNNPRVYDNRLVFTVIDSEGYRPNVGIILCNADGRLFWARRIGQHSWQFPQGGIQRDESPEQAMFRELAEEVGLRPEHVQIVGCTRGWLRYRLPRRLIRQGNQTPCIGQKQVWFLLRMLGAEDAVCLDASEHPEFDHWQWVDYWYPLRAVVPFKRHVYWCALRELAPLLLPPRAVKRSFAAGHYRQERALNPAGQRIGLDRPTPPARLLEAAVEVAMDAALEAVALAACPPDSVRPTAAKPTGILPLRWVETTSHPVITRTLVSARRGGIVESLALVSATHRETASIAPALDRPRASDSSQSRG